MAFVQAGTHSGDITYKHVASGTYGWGGGNWKLMYTADRDWPMMAALGAGHNGATVTRDGVTQYAVAGGSGDPRAGSETVGGGWMYFMEDVKEGTYIEMWVNGSRGSLQLFGLDAPELIGE